MPIKTITCVLVLMASAVQAHGTNVLKIGCPSDGQLGPQPAPASGTISIPLEAKAAERLAYYHANELGVLAPRGWHCLQLLGSNGAFLLVTPDTLSADGIFKDHWKITGPGVQLSDSLGGTSGRMEVAPIAARIFPQARKYVAGVRAFLRDMNMPSKFSTRPWPADRLTRLRKDIVEYETPGGAEGLGTRSRLKKNSFPIAGVAILSGDNDEPDLTLLSVRLPPDTSSLTPLIVHQVEADNDHGAHP
jgi:hypothetical protein